MSDQIERQTTGDDAPMQQDCQGAAVSGRTRVSAVAPLELPEPLTPERLRWICDPDVFPFETTRDVEPIARIIGQGPAADALQYGIEARAKGQNVFVRGLEGTGRASLVRQNLEAVKAACGPARDRCYVHDFTVPDRPALITLPRGRGHAFRSAIDRFARYVREELARVLASDVVRVEKAALERQSQRQVQEVGRANEEKLQALIERNIRSLLEPLAAEIASEFETPAVRRFLGQVIQDVLERQRWARSDGGTEEGDFSRLYAVNVILAHEEGTTNGPIVVETAPTLHSLLGTIHHNAGSDGGEVNHHSITGGSLLRADGGFLVIEAREILSEEGAWKVLVRTLKTGLLHLTPPAPYPVWPIAPQPIDVDIKVILMGDHEVFDHLNASDPDFPHLFKILVDFDDTIPRDDEGLALYAGALARIVKQQSLPPFHRDAVATLTEHGARIASQSGKLTARFGRLADIAREASWIARQDSNDVVRGAHVLEALRAGKRRASLPSRRFRELVMEQTLRVQATGKAVGQINGLAVLHAGPLTYGFPARITATIGAGTSGIINIEREAALSGAIHTKGFLLLGGVLRTLLQTDHPLTFNASIAFEQSYGGIDGDSASGAEVCCLLSALAAVPLRQDVAMTGAVDQMGNILAVGAVNEKIEGFFDSCRDLAGGRPIGVIIPASNAGDLMLRADLLEAARQGMLRVWAVRTVHEALEILTGMPAGVRDRGGVYPDGSLLALAMKQAREYWIRTSQVSHRPDWEPPLEAGAASMARSSASGDLDLADYRPGGADDVGKATQLRG